MEDMRLQRFLARRGYGSRRACEEMIRAGRVTVNGSVATLGLSVEPADEVAVDGKPLKAQPKPAYLMLYKPPGVIVSRRDTRGRETIQSFLPTHLLATVFPVGRLDQDSEGLLLLTNDGDLAQSLLHPRYGVHRSYLAWVSGNVSPAVPAALRQGVQLDDGPAAALQARWVKRWAGGGLLQVTLAEGRKREVRRLCAALGLRVARLKRVSFGPLRLGDLAPGQLRPLTRGEVAALRRTASGSDQGPEAPDRAGATPEAPARGGPGPSPAPRGRGRTKRRP